jgi:positive regulator of sigma E activity
VEELRRRTRAAAHPVWFPVTVFGLLGLGACLAGVAGDGVGIGLFWLVAGPAGGWATARYYCKRARSLGVGVRGGAHVALGTALFVTAWVAGAATRSAAAPMLAIAVAHLGFARLERSWPVAALSAFLGAVVVVIVLSRPAHGDVLLTAAFGVSFTLTGLVLRPPSRA